MSAYDDYSSLRRPSLAEMYKFIMKAAKEEHLMRGDWESNRDEISCEADQFIKDSIRDDAAVTDGKGIVVTGLKDGNMYIYDLYVLPEYRHQGVASKLVNYVKSISNGRNVALTVNSKNSTAMSLYAKLGFEEVRRFNYDGYSLIEMICKSRQ